MLHIFFVGKKSENHVFLLLEGRIRKIVPFDVSTESHWQIVVERFLFNRFNDH